MKDIENFETNLWNIVKNVRLPHYSNSFLKALNYNMASIKQSPNIHTMVDKTKEIYEINFSTYSMLLTSINDITKRSIIPLK